MVKNMIYLRWWLSFTLICLGGIASWYFGLVANINEADFTKISFLIYGLFAVYTVLTGVNTKKACGDNLSENYDVLCRKNESGWFVASLLTGLGMVGTVAGFIYMLGTSFEQLQADNVASMTAALKQMGGGMATALYTTGVGLVCSLLLKIQLFNLSQHLDAHKSGCSCSTTCGGEDA
jgi:hypothetical protein